MINKNKKYMVNLGSVHKNKFFIFSTDAIIFDILTRKPKYFNLYLLKLANGSIISLIIFNSSFSIK